MGVGPGVDVDEIEPPPDPAVPEALLEPGTDREPPEAGVGEHDAPVAILAEEVEEAGIVRS